MEAGQSITKPKNELTNVNKRIQELEAKRRTERWEESNTSGTKMRKVGGLTKKEEAELKISNRSNRTLPGKCARILSMLILKISLVLATTT